MVTGVGLLLVWRARPPAAGDPTRRRRRRLAQPVVRRPRRCCARRAFIGYVLQSAFAISVFFAFVAGAPYYMLDILDRPATEYGLWFIIVSVGFMVGNFFAARLTARVGLDRMVLARQLPRAARRRCWPRA